MLRDDVNARLSVTPDASDVRGDDPFLKAVQGAAADDFTVLGEIGRGADGVIIYLSREVASGRLVALRLQREGQLAHEFSLELVRHLDNSMPAPESKCFKCGKPIRGWARFCSFCGADLSGATPGDNEAGSAAAMLAALNEAVAGEYEVLGEMARSEGGGAVYFARDRQSNRIVALRLQREGNDDAFSIGETTALKPLAASLGVKPVATQLFGSLVPPTPATGAMSTPAAPVVPAPAPLAAAAVPPAPRPTTPPPPKPAGGDVSRRMQIIGGAILAVVLVVVAIMFFAPEQKAGPVVSPPLPHADSTPAVVTAAPPPTAPVAAPPPPPAAAVAPAVVKPVMGVLTVKHLATDATITIDGTAWSVNKPIHLRAGPHVVAVTLAGYLPYTETVQLAAGENHDVTPQLVVQPKSPSSKPAPAPEPTHKGAPANTAALQCQKFMDSKDWKQAAQQCTTEAGAGSAVAKRNLGLLYNHGNGVSSSDKDAVSWYQQAVEGGDRTAMYLLGTFYEHGGGGIKKDGAAALQLYTKSADAGYLTAQMIVAEAYEKGHFGADKNRSKAVEYYKKAAAQGDKDAIGKVKDLDKP